MHTSDTNAPATTEALLTVDAPQPDAPQPDAPEAASDATTVDTSTSDKPAKPSRKRASKPTSDKPTKRASKPAKPAATTEAQPGEPAFLVRKAATIEAMRYPFGQASGRDEAYAAFYALAMRDHGTGPVSERRTVTLAMLATYGKRNPLAGADIASAPATDAGAAERFAKRGFGTFDRDTRTLTLSDAGAKHAASMLSKLRRA